MFIFNRPFAAVVCALGVAFLMPSVESFFERGDGPSSGRAAPENVLTLAPPDESRHLSVGTALDEPPLARLSRHEQQVLVRELQHAFESAGGVRRGCQSETGKKRNAARFNPRADIC